MERRKTAVIPCAWTSQENSWSAYKTIQDKQAWHAGNDRLGGGEREDAGRHSQESPERQNKVILACNRNLCSHQAWLG